MSRQPQQPFIPPPPFSCTVLREQDTAHFHLVGALDLGTTPVLQNEIAAVREAGARSVILDLRNLTFMDSTGLRCILDTDAEARQDGFSISLIQGPPNVRRVFEITNTDAHLRFVER